MARHLRPETLEFLESAPLRWSFATRLAAPADAVFSELADTPGEWPLWFREVSSVEYTGEPPYGNGSARRVRLAGGGRFVETVLAWDPAQRFVYRVDETNVPGMLAIMEEWRLTASPYGGTVLRWTTALDARQPVRAGWLVARPLLGRAFRRAGRRLDARIADRAAGG